MSGPPLGESRDTSAFRQLTRPPYRVGHLLQLLDAEPREPEGVVVLAPHSAKEYVFLVKRLSSFFVASNYTNVHGLFA
jgi:hypothetical protein